MPNLCVKILKNTTAVQIVNKYKLKYRYQIYFFNHNYYNLFTFNQKDIQLSKTFLTI